MSKTCFISTAIPYVNSQPHVGFAMELVHADALARSRRLAGEEVFFVNGTDENGLKNVQAAASAGEPVAQFVARHAQEFQELGRELEISSDYFIRTSADPLHWQGAEKLWQATSHDIYKKAYRGLYCVGCEEFKTEAELVNGRCVEHPDRELEVVEEENYFFRLSQYEQQLKELISSDQLRIHPSSRKNEMLAFIERGLEDFSISRSRARAGEWGISVPGDNSQVMYVWYDALSNYINALGYADDSEQFKKFWQRGNERLHVIGKGITRFHALYWPALLLSAGLALPTTLVVHGYVTSGGQKMSKSLGNVINPFDLIKEYGAEAVRYYLLRHVHPSEDSDITLEKFKEAYNANLANGLGNLVSRVMKLAQTYLPVDTEKKSFSLLRPYDLYLENFEINKALDAVWQEISDIDLFIQQTEPFKKIKTDPKLGTELILVAISRLYKIGYWLEPFMPKTSAKIMQLIKDHEMPDEPLFARK